MNTTRKKIERKKKLIELNKSWIRKQYDKLNIRFKFSIITLISLLVLITSQDCKNYMNHNNIKCLVLDKIELPRKGNIQTVIVLKDPKDRIFDLFDLNNNNYQINQYYNISLRELDINQTFLKTIYFVFLPVVLISLSLGLFFATVKIKVPNDILYPEKIK